MYNATVHRVAHIFFEPVVSSAQTRCAEGFHGRHGSEAEDGFGATLAASDFDGDGAGDLAVGVPGESLGSISNAGKVNVIYGASGGPLLTGSGNQHWHQNSIGVTGTSQEDDLFGFALN